MKYDLHIHSMYSKDSFLRPEIILKVAKKKGLDGIAITDHNTIKGAVAARKINYDRNFTVITGAEIKTEFGDVVGIFLQEEVKSRLFAEVIEEIKGQGGYAVLAHPYRQYPEPERLVNKVDLIEAFNARSKKLHNDQSYDLALRNHKPFTAGSDAHLSFEIGRGCISINGNIHDYSSVREMSGKASNYYLVHGFSVMMEQIKRLGH
ncbi:MAG: PHP domain-containing protein [Dehalobacter sp.]|nr:PHP domain-containing protein [Dehalobacter sp.]